MREGGNKEATEIRDKGRGKKTRERERLQTSRFSDLAKVPPNR